MWLGKAIADAFLSDTPDQLAVVASFFKLFLERVNGCITLTYTAEYGSSMDFDINGS